MALVVACLLRMLGVAEYVIIVLVETVHVVVVGPARKHIVAEAQSAWGNAVLQLLPKALVETEWSTAANWGFPQTVANSHIPVVEK